MSQTLTIEAKARLRNAWLVLTLFRLLNLAVGWLKPETVLRWGNGILSLLKAETSIAGGPWTEITVNLRMVRDGDTYTVEQLR